MIGWKEFGREISQINLLMDMVSDEEGLKERVDQITKLYYDYYDKF